MTRLITVAALLVGLGACSTPTGNLEVGDCVRFDPTDFTFGGDLGSASCNESTILNDVWRVSAVGSETDVDRACPILGFVIIDGDDAACLVK